jgi:acetoin utilization deacetylase AcuC-like enzyme
LAAKTKVIYSPHHKLHIGTGPEIPSRVEAILHSLKDREIIEPLKANEEQLLKFHKKYYIDAVKTIDAKAKNIAEYQAAIKKKRYSRMVDGTVIVHGSYEAACYAAGSIIEAMKDEYNAVFALTRPPGHHAHPDFTHGFCIFNNTCVGIENSKKRRILIIDLDLHFGDGVYSFYKNRKEVKYLSFSFIRFDLPNLEARKNFRRPNIKTVRQIFSRFDPEIVYFITGYDSLDFGYLSIEEYLRIFKTALKYVSGRKLILELSGGYDLKKLPEYVNKTIQIVDSVLI